MPNDTAAEEAGSAENRDNTIARGCHGSSASLTTGMAFGFSQVTHVLNKAKRFLKIAKAKGSFDTMAVIAQVPIRSLRLKTLRFLMCERRNAAATRGAFFRGERLDHVLALG